ncbi:MAG: hybrid sensor histidine kinase/response regulator, partial [Anaerolineae bacterium]|nr:hybrid sensor histidine kinase/response regulator [Anaerolineae bacterium]
MTYRGGKSDAISTSQGSTSNALDFEGYTILVIDDNATNLGVVTDYLKEYGCKTLVARDGEVGYQRAKQGQPDLILLDVLMPKVDGFETCRLLQADELTQSIPVIFMTALNDEKDKVMGFEVGGVDYITKPIQPAEVLARIKTHLRIRELTKNLQAKTDSLQETNRTLNQTLTSLKATQAQLVESEKLAALGNLVAGVAHEINTPIGIGVTAASTLGEETEILLNAYKSGHLKRSVLDRYTDAARQSSHLLLTNLNRAADLVQSFKQVAVDQASLEQRNFRVKPYLEEVLVSLGPHLKHTGHTVTVEGDDTLTLTSYPGALAQTATNLIMNSITHAYKNGQTGYLKFDLTRNENKFRLAYSDDGCGIPANNLNKIFDPFFTTRRGQGGTGL